jgi:hypothetical protein
MTWHYKAGRFKNPDGSYHYQVIEWYVPDHSTDEAGMDVGWTDAITPSGDTKQELIRDLEMMLEDVKHHDVFTLEPPGPTP